MTVAEINALLYSPNHPRDRLERALRIAALSPGWRSSFEALLQSQTTAEGSGNAGLVPAAAAHPVAPGFRQLAVAAIDQECADVLSLTMQSLDGQPLPTALPGQYVVLRLPRTPGDTPLFRSYSLSGPASTERYRISVKIEPNGAAGSYLREHVRVGDALDVSSPRGSFIPQPGERPVVLLSAGIGATPVLAMLYALAATPLHTTGLVAVRGSRSAASSIRRRSPPPHAPRSPTAAGMFVTAGRARATRWARISTPPVTCRDRSSTRSACRERRTSISAGRLASWQT